MPEPRGNAPEPSGPGQAMSAHTGRQPPMLMRISVPAEGALRDLAGEVGSKIAEYLGSRHADVESIAAAIEVVAGKVAPPGGCAGDITFEFHAVRGELVVHAHCDDRSSETRHRLPA